MVKTIRKFKKITADDQGLAVTYDAMKTDDATALLGTISRRSPDPIHPDMADALRRLAPHLAILAEVRGLPEGYTSGERPYHGATLSHLVDKAVTVRGVQLTHSTEGGKGYGVRIIGTVSVRAGGLSIKTPCVDDTVIYPYRRELFAAVDVLLREVTAYLDEDKTAFRQLDMFADATPENSPKTPKKRTKSSK